MIYIGDSGETTMTNKAESVSIPIHHTGIFGRTGSGKTTLVKEMIKQAVKEDFRVLIFDSKLTQAEFEDMGVAIPFYLQENTDPDVYRSLIEGVRTRGRGNMERFRGGFIELCEPPGGQKAKDFTEIERRLRAKLSDPKIRGFTKSMYSEIYHDHLKLNEMLGKHTFSTSLHPLNGLFNNAGQIIRMPVRELPNLNLQGLVVRSTVEWLLQYSGLARVIVVVDEAPNFVNQKLYNPAKSALQQLDSQGRSAQLFGWYTGQTLTGFDKGNMKNLYYWIMGGQSERNEVKAFLDTQSEAVVTRDEVKRLKVREFVVSTPDWAKLVTVPKVGQSEFIKEVEKLGIPRAFPDNDKMEEIHAQSVAQLAPQLVGSVIQAAARANQIADMVKSREAFLDKWSGKSGSEGSGAAQSEVKSPSSPPSPEPKTEPIGSFTLVVTRLHSDSLESKLLYLANRGGAMRQAELIQSAEKYGWPLVQSEVSEALRAMVKKGLLIYTETSRRYSVPSEVKVEEIPA